jgi:hypothetical protein
MCGVRLFLLGVCLCGGVRFGVLCTNCYFFLNDIVVLPLLFVLKKFRKFAQMSSPVLVRQSENEVESCKKNTH